MSHGIVEGAGAAAAVSPASLPPAVAALQRLVDGLDRILVLVASIALLAGAFVLTESVVVRYVLQSSTDWQDETTVFLLVGTTFLSAPWVQSWRGHVAIEALSEILPARVNRIRVVVADVVSFAFCAFFSWKAWTLLGEAVEDGQVTSSSWGPPLWIPYSTMSVGMTLLTVRIALQILSGMTRRAPA